MSTTMHGADWELALEVFRARLPARGARAKDEDAWGGLGACSGGLPGPPPGAGRQGEG